MKNKLIEIVFIALFSALIAVGAFIRIPFPPVPISLQTLFCLISALVLPLKLSIISCLVYLFLGSIGLPIFTAGGGIALLLGPTGGYLIGLIPAVLITSCAYKKNSYRTNILFTSLATISIYIPGLLWLSFITDLNLKATLITGLVPFIIGDIIKIIISSSVALKIKPLILEKLDY